MQFRGTLHFVARDAEGFSETYYLQGADHTSAATLLEDLRTARLGMLIDTVFCVRAEVALTDHARDSVVVGATGPTQFPGTYSPVSGTVPLPTQVAVLFDLNADPSHKNRKFLHGWTSIDVDGNRYAPSPGMIAAAQTYVDALTNGAFQVRTNRHANPLPPPRFTYDYLAITTVQAGNVTTRRIGRPFGLPVGRRRAG